tara:strand:- start:5536 stop:6306 length:771 start_codon:yes stop_codon:yes gene_type:complete
MAENYQLSCCSTGEMLQINNLPAVFVFTGITQNDNHPDNFQEVVLTAIKDINSNVITGCYKLVEWNCPEEYEQIAWEDFFVITECVDTCIECLPKPEPVKVITNHKTIYPEFKVNNVDPNKAESIFCKFGSAIYEEVLELRYGIKHCCPTDLMHSRIAFEILKMDITENKLDCCPNPPVPAQCKKYKITLPVNIQGVLYFKDCYSREISVEFAASSHTNQVNVCGITGQTGIDIYAKDLTGTLISLSFVEQEGACP